MTKYLSTHKVTSAEVIFQLILHLLVFIFYSVDRSQPNITSQETVYFLTYALAAFIINYYFLPRYYFQKKHLHFFTLVFLMITCVILVEELVLEPIYFPKRADSFGGVFFTLVQILPVITILVGFKFAWDALTKQRELDNLRTAVTESELQFLKSQINPHFLFNNLNNLYSYAMENSPKTPEIILELSGVLRYMLYECKEKYVPLTKEVEQLANFIKLNEMQIEERGHVNFSAANIPEGYRIAPLILIVFIENAFKHSTATQSENISIWIDLTISNSGILNFVCRNSFQTLSNTASLTQGIGMENVRKRLQLLYPNAHELKISTVEKQYEVSLTIQLNHLEV